MAIQAAHRSEHKTKVGAVVVKAGKVLAVKPNLSKNNPLHVHYTKCSVHAEVAALRCCGLGARGATLFVARLGGRLVPLPAKPCSRCMPYIVNAKVKRIVYTLEEGIGTCNVRQLLSV